MKNNIRRLRAALAFSALGFSLCAAPVARAQEAPEAPATPTDAAPAKAPAKGPTSIVVGITLPQALRIEDKQAVDELSSQLKKLAAQAKLPLGAPEVMAWSGEEYKRANASEIVAQAKISLKDAGYAYIPMGKPLPAQGSTTSLFTMTQDEQKKMVLGYWVEADTMMLLVWAAVQPPEAPAEAPAPEKAPQAPAE